ncbi:MAG: hypothetical protein AB7Q17_15745 [Phycisphaerae bacterium]
MPEHAPGLLAELHDLAAAGRAAAALEYAEILARRETPKAGDAKQLKVLAAELGRSLADVAADAEALAEIERAAEAAALIAEREAAAAAAKSAYRELVARCEELGAALKAAQDQALLAQGRTRDTGQQAAIARDAVERRRAGAVRWWHALGVESPGAAAPSVLRAEPAVL